MPTLALARDKNILSIWAFPRDCISVFRSSQSGQLSLARASNHSNRGFLEAQHPPKNTWNRKKKHTVVSPRKSQNHQKKPTSSRPIPSLCLQKRSASTFQGLPTYRRGGTHHFYNCGRVQISQKPMVIFKTPPSTIKYLAKIGLHI